jgi:hypothetical protein
MEYPKAEGFPVWWALGPEWMSSAVDFPLECPARVAEVSSQTKLPSAAESTIASQNDDLSSRKYDRQPK